MIAAAVAGSSGSASPSPPPSALLNPDLYWGTLRPSASCANPKSCTTFDASLTNKSKVTINSFMLDVLTDRFTAFNIQGAACKNTGMQFGPNFRNAWLCLGLHVPPGATVVGSGTAAKPLTASAVARFDWSDRGSAGGLMPDTSQDIHFATLITPEARLDLEIAETHVESAIADEQMLPADTVKEIGADARRGSTELAKAEVALKAADKSGGFKPGAIGPIIKLVDNAIFDDTKAEHAATPGSAKAWMKRASVAKVGALTPTVGAAVRLSLP